jgi:hypothetical protein
VRADWTRTGGMPAVSDVTRRQESRHAALVIGWFVVSVAICAAVTYLRNLVFWAIAYFGLLGARLDEAAGGATLGSALREATRFTPLDLRLHAYLLIPGLLVLAGLAGRLGRLQFRLAACLILFVLTIPAVVVVPGPVSYHVLDLMASVLIGLLLPLRRRPEAGDGSRPDG